MSAYPLTFKDFRNTTLANQSIISGASVSEKNNDIVFLITSIFGSAITLKDKNDTILATTLSTLDFSVPLVMKGGFTVSGTNLTVVFSRLPQGT